MFSLLIPHMRRAVNIHRQIAAGEAHAALNRELINRRPDARGDPASKPQRRGHPTGNPLRHAAASPLPR